MNGEIIFAEQPDIPTILDIWKNAGIRSEPEDAPDRLLRFFDNEYSCCYKAIFHDTIVGVIMCGSDGRYGYIHHVAVEAACRKQGVGRALVDKCRFFLKDMVYKTILE